MSRKRNKKAMDLVKNLRAKGLSFREISRIMRKDIKTIFMWNRWNMEGVDKLA